MNEKLSQFLGTIFGIVVMVLLIMAGINYSKKRDTNYPWKGSIFLEKENSQTVLKSKDFKTVEDCRDWVNSQEKDLNSAYENWDYSCGYKCEYTDDDVVGGKRVKHYDCEKLTK